MRGVTSQIQADCSVSAVAAATAATRLRGPTAWQAAVQLMRRSLFRRKGWLRRRRIRATVGQANALNSYITVADSNGQFGGAISRIALGTASYRTLENVSGSPSRLTGITSSG
jgi:hypothetical protein